MNLIIYAVVAIALIGAAAGFYGKIHHDGYAQGTAETQAKWDAANRKAEEQSRAKEAADKLAKDSADAEHKAAVDRLNSTISKLRADADKRRASFLPAAPAATTSTDTACFDRPQYLGAYGSLVEGLRGLANEGSQAVTDLDSAKKWANERR